MISMKKTEAYCICCCEFEYDLTKEDTNVLNFLV